MTARVLLFYVPYLGLFRPAWFFPRIFVSRRPCGSRSFFRLDPAAALPYASLILALRKRSHVLKKLFQILLVSLGCLHLAGGPYSLMQAYAWAGMLVTYSQQDGLLEGAKNTFSGEKPCELCCKIAAAKKSEPAREKKEAPVPPSTGKLLQEFLLSGTVSVAPPRFNPFIVPAFPGVLVPVETAGASPPVPPPRDLA